MSSAKKKYKKKASSFTPSKKSERQSYVITMNERAQSINEVARHSLDAKGLKALKLKWQGLASYYLRKAIDRKGLPEKFDVPIIVTFWIYFDVIRNRDKDNYYIVSKAIIDAMVDIGLIKDDSEEFADFGGIKFRKADKPRIEIQIEAAQRTFKDLAPVSEENAVTLAHKLDPAMLDQYGIDLDKMRPDMIQYAYFKALPYNLRPSNEALSKHFGLAQGSIYQWGIRKDVSGLILAINRTVLAYDVPEVLGVVKERSLAGDMKAAKLFLEYVTEHLKPQINIQNNINMVELSAKDIKSVIQNLDESSNGNSATKSGASPRVEVVVES